MLAVRGIGAFICVSLIHLFAAVHAKGATDDLISAIAKGDADSVLQQVGHGTPPNDANSKGQLPLSLSVSQGDVKTTEVLLNYHANSTLSEPQSGMSAMTIVFSKANAPLAELLMKYGGDPDALDGTGRSARSFVKPNSKLEALVKKWDADGASAFEDAPGVWARHVHESHSVPFYFNKNTGESQFLVPTSCAWTKAVVDGHPIYTNYVTHQARWTRPAALAWKLLHSATNKETPYWYNYITDATTLEVPAELPSGMAEEIRHDAGSFFHNTVTKEASWENPAENSWRQVHDPQGRLFWYHPKTGEATWERPSSLSWTTIPAEEGHVYYHNERTASVQWEKPEEIAWEKVQYNPHVNILSS